MNPSPRTQPVEECGPDVREKAVTIRPIEKDRFELVVDDDGAVAARSVSAITLSMWAFAHGALRVKHDYDLRFCR